MKRWVGTRSPAVLLLSFAAFSSIGCDRDTPQSPATAPTPAVSTPTAATPNASPAPKPDAAEAFSPGSIAPSVKSIRMGLPGPDRAAVIGDGSKFVVVGGDRATLAVRVGPYYVATMDAADGKPVKKSDFNANPVAGFMPAADGKHVVFWGASPSRVLPVPPFSVWNVDTGTAVARFGEAADSAAVAAAISPDGSRVISSGGKQPVRLWDARSGQRLGEFRTEHTIDSIALSKNASLALLGGGEDDESVTLLDLASGRELLSLAGHHAVVTSVAFSPDETKLLSTSADGTVRLWDRATGRELRRLRLETGVASAEFDSTGRRLLILTKPTTWRSPEGSRVLQVNDIRLWDLASAAPLAKFAAEERQCFESAGFAKEGREIVAASDYHLHRWAVPENLPQDALASLDEPRLPNETDPEFFTATMENVLSVGYLANGDAFAATENNTVTRWALEQKAVVGSYATAASPQLNDARSVSSDGRLAVAVSRLSGKKATIWELASGLTVAEPETTGRVVDAAFSPDASLVAVGVLGREPVDTHLAFFRTADGSSAGTIATPACHVKVIAFAPDGNTVAVIGNNETSIEVFELDTAKRLKQLMAPNNARLEEIVFARDGSRILSTNFQTIVVWDAASNQIVFQQKPADDVTTVAISPDGRRLLIGDKESNLQLWDIAANARIAVFDHHRRPITSVAFSPDGKTALSAARDQTVRAWRLPPSTR